jgi:hypothetical protein
LLSPHQLSSSWEWRVSWPLLYQRPRSTAFVRVPGKKCRRAIDRSEPEHVTKDMPSLRNVPADLWEAAQQRFRRTSPDEEGRRPAARLAAPPRS